jgi:TetR/AcrR family transcriptional regulator, fatty acid metabolism regulator protein
MSSGRGPLGLRDRLREVREEVVLDVASDLMDERGYADTSMDEVAARSGMSKATIYQLFTTKGELAISVVLRTMARSIAILDSLDPALSPMTRIERGLKQCLEAHAGFDGSQVWAAVAHQDSRYLHMRTELTRRIEGLVEAAKAAGEMHPDVTAPMAIVLFEAIVHAKLEHGDGASGELLDGLLSIVFRGLRAQQDPGGPSQARDAQRRRTLSGPSPARAPTNRRRRAESGT